MNTQQKYMYPAKRCFYIVQRDVINAQRLLACVDNQGKVVIIQINRMNKDIDNCSAFIYIVRRHIADIVEESVNLQLGQANLFVLLNSNPSFYQGVRGVP